MCVSINIIPISRVGCTGLIGNSRNLPLEENEMDPEGEWGRGEQSRESGVEGHVMARYVLGRSAAHLRWTHLWNFIKRS